MQDHRSFEPVRVKGPGGPGPLPIVAIIGLVLVLALVKPWESIPGDGTARMPSGTVTVSPAPSGAAPASPIPSPSQPPESVVADLCYGPGGWRTVSYEAWREQRTRVWRAVVPAFGTDPLDPTIPEVFVSASRILALGWCAPVSGPERPDGDAMATWYRLDGRGRATPFAPIRLLPRGPLSAFGALYAPPGATCPVEGEACIPWTAPTGGPDATWPTGRYVLRVRDLADDADRWLAITVETRGDD